jgi:hypothetical protein
VEAAVLNPDRAIAVAEDETAEAVPLDLEEVVGRAEGGLGRSGLHRPQLGGKALELNLKLIRIGRCDDPHIKWIW